MGGGAQSEEELCGEGLDWIPMGCRSSSIMGLPTNRSDPLFSSVGASARSSQLKERRMKGLITTAIAFVLAASALGQSTNQNDALEQEIRHREQAQVDALLKNDIAAMKRNWAADYVVNNPMNEVVDASRG